MKSGISRLALKSVDLVICNSCDPVTEKKIKKLTRICGRKVFFYMTNIHFREMSFANGIRVGRVSSLIARGQYGLGLGSFTGVSDKDVRFHI